jgi:hypothetical protein
MQEHELEPTGYGVVRIRGRQLARHHEEVPGNKRGIILALYERDGEASEPFVATVQYTTGWKQEAPFTWMLEAPTLRALSDMIRDKAKDAVAPGAGFPPLPQYEQRQQHLRERMCVATLTALDACLKQAQAHQ